LVKIEKKEFLYKIYKETIFSRPEEGEVQEKGQREGEGEEQDFRLQLGPGEGIDEKL
jgi:hypothetical protein